MALWCCQTPIVLCIAIACCFVAFTLDGVAYAELCVGYPNNIIVENGSFVGDAFWSGRVRNVTDCAVACVRRKKCVGFNYDPLEKLCQLFGALANDTIMWTSSENLLYSYIANWTSEIDPNCFSRPCDINAVCVPGNFSTLFSVVDDCSHTCINFTMLCPKLSANFSGPRSMGSTFTCGDGQPLTCLDSLQWSDTCTI